MNNTVWKYPIPLEDEFSIEMPKGFLSELRKNLSGNVMTYRCFLRGVI